MNTADRATAKLTNANMELPEPQDFYVDYREVSRYTFLTDMYYGTGGVSGRTKAKTGRPKIRGMQYNGRMKEPAYTFLSANPSENFFATRVRKSYYVNNYRRYITTKYKGVFKVAPHTTVTAEGSTKTIENHPYLDFVKNINGASGTARMDKNTFMQNLLSAVYRDEVAYIIMDREEGDPQPYAYIQTAGCVVDYDTDIRGNLTDISFVNEKKDGSAVKYEWSLEGLTTYAAAPGDWSGDDSASKWVQQGEVDTAAVRYGLPVLPVFAGPREDPHDYLPRPQSYDIAQLCLSIYESGSMLDWVLEKQGHDTMYVTGDIEGKKEGLSNILILENLDGNAQAGILSPDANKATVHQNRVEQKTDELFELMLDGGVLVSRSSNAPESGLAKSYTFSPVNDALLESTKISRLVDTWMQEWYKAFMGGNFIAVTHYREDFSPVVRVDVMTLRESISIFEERGLTENAKKALKRIIMTLNDSEDKEIVEDLLAEVDQVYTRPDNSGSFF